MSESPDHPQIAAPPSLTDLGEPLVRVEMRSQPRLLAGTRELVGAIAKRLGFSELEAGQIGLALDEALANVIRHGYKGRDDGLIMVSLWVSEGDGSTVGAGLHLCVEDQCPQVDPSKIRSRELSEVRPGGLGVHLIQEIMDASVFEKREQSGMRLRMSKFIPHNAGTMTGSVRHAG
ncbi:MAG: ATP-binding protein [Planctomycetota bacterium]